MDTLILVNGSDQQIGLADKMTTHQLGLLHRAFSIVLLRNNNGVLETLLQQRAHSKYHAGGLWTNTCCSHFLPAIEDCVPKRLQYEMGMKANLKYAGKFKYKAKLGSLIEHEIDHVYYGLVASDPIINPKEVMAYDWVDFNELASSELDPDLYTPWLANVLQIVKAQLN